MAEDLEREKLERLLGFLEQDPDNSALLRDAAQAAMVANEPAQVASLLARLGEAGAAEDGDRNLAAIAMMRSGRLREAAEEFERLLAASPEDQALKFNLAWARAMAKDFAGARELLDDVLTQHLPQAALLDVQLRHDAGEFEEAAVKARAYLTCHADYPPLLAAVSVLALDVEDEELARQCAEKAGGHPDALTTLGTLTLGEMEHANARAMFEQALAINDRSPRAWVGLGLAHMAAGEGVRAGEVLDKGAELFEDHLGTWLAAGWAYLVANDPESARERFEHALQLDPNFAESHGSLAVMDMLVGDRESAERRVEIALRLDRACFSAAFAKVLMESAEGNAQKAQRIIDIALNQPLDGKGRTIGAALARLGR